MKYTQTKSIRRDYKGVYQCRKCGCTYVQVTPNGVIVDYCKEEDYEDFLKSLTNANTIMRLEEYLAASHGMEVCTGECCPMSGGCSRHACYKLCNEEEQHRATTLAYRNWPKLPCFIPTSKKVKKQSAVDRMYSNKRLSDMYLKNNDHEE